MSEFSKLQLRIEQVAESVIKLEIEYCTNNEIINNTNNNANSIKDTNDNDVNTLMNTNDEILKIDVIYQQQPQQQQSQQYLQQPTGIIIKNNITTTASTATTSATPDFRSQYKWRSNTSNVDQVDEFNTMQVRLYIWK